MAGRYCQRGQPDLGLMCYQGGAVDILVEGFKLGGRAKRIFVDVVKEDLKLDGGGLDGGS